MNRKSFYFILFMLMLFVACGKTDEKPEEDSMDVVSQSYEAMGDSMLYGLACDGCTDTTLVLLPDSGGDPVTYSIVRARSEKKFFGRPQIGDKMAVMVNPDDSTELLVVINLDQVMGTWYYEQLPVLRRRAHIDSAEVQQMEFTEEEKAHFDSLLSTLMIPREYAYTFKRDFTMRTEGGPPRTTSLDRDLPVVYPPMTRYMEWHIFNGKIILTYGGMKIAGMKDSLELTNDTAEFVLLRSDTMALRFRDHVQGFRLRPDTLVEN